MKSKNFIFSIAALLILSLASCNQKTVETTDNYEIVDLPDGSWVYLNQNSSISYDEAFTSRKIQASGEIFINVKSDADNPFEVETDHASIKVLGTEFAVESRNDKTAVEVKSGKVKVTKGQIVKDLKRGERALVKEGQDAIKVMDAQFNADKWIKQLEIELRKLDRDVKNVTKDIDKGLKNMEKDLKKGLKEITK